MTRPLLSLVLALTALTAPAQERPLLPSITDATWREHRDYYPKSPACAANEITLWTCETHKRVFSLCSSQVLNRASGYMQYRALSGGKVVFTYPAVKKPPLGSFKFNSSPTGNASVEFTNNGYHYRLYDRLRGNSSIFVSEPGPSGKTTEIECGSNQTLQVNYTLRLMYDSGIWEGD